MNENKLDARSLFVLLKLADQVVERCTSPAYENINRHNPDELVPVTVMVQASRLYEFRAARDNTRRVLEHVTFSVDPPHASPGAHDVHYADSKRD